MTTDETTRTSPLGTALDVFRMRQYFNAIVRAVDLAAAVREDASFLTDVRRAFLPLPFDRHRPVTPPFPLPARVSEHALKGRRVAVAATGGSGALASVVGVARALEEADVPVAAYSLCSGSALFGFPLAAGLSAAEVAELTLGLEPAEYVDVDWQRLVSLGPTLARGWAGVLRGDRLEAYYRRHLGDVTLGELPIPAYAPIWNVEQNRLDYLGSKTHPDMPLARAIRMAVALPLFFEPVELDGSHWCDGGIVDIFPVHPLLDIEPVPDAVIAVNGFYPHEFAGEDATGWENRALSIVHVASQVRTCQQIQLARENLARLRAATDVVLLDPVPYQVVRGTGFYRQFIDTRDWPVFMQAGRDATLDALHERAGKVAAPALAPG